MLILLNINFFAGELYYIEIQTYGPVDKDSLSLNFVSINGTVLNQVKVKHSSSDLIATAVLPDDGKSQRPYKTYH